jgi:hypothetical protein
VAGTDLPPDPLVPDPPISVFPPLILGSQFCNLAASREERTVGLVEWWNDGAVERWN